MGGGQFEPVEGVTLEKYAELAAAMTGATTAEEAEERAVARGLPPGRYAAIAEVWNERVLGIPEVGARYSELYLSALKDQGVEAPELTEDQFVELMSLQAGNRGKPADDILERFGLTPQTYALVSQEWAQRMMTDMSLGMRIGQRLAAAMQASQAKPPPPEEPTGTDDIKIL